jgi:dihydrolipoamide dehydrogenase
MRNDRVVDGTPRELSEDGDDVVHGTVAVGSDTYTARTIVLATGSVKRPIPGARFGDRVIDTEEAGALPELPKS